MQQDLKDFVEVFNKVQSIANQISHNKGFWEGDLDPDDPNFGLINAGKIALMHSELSEAMEAIRKPKKDEHLPDINPVALELADLIIRVMDFAQERGLDVGEALIKKMLYNNSRDYKHGGKQF